MSKNSKGRTRPDPVRVLEDGSIGDDYGILYDGDSLIELSDAARARLAELHNANADLHWEGSAGRKGAWDILREEGLM